jgi:hypothetical protein
MSESEMPRRLNSMLNEWYAVTSQHEVEWRNDKADYWSYTRVVGLLIKINGVEAGQ